MTSRWTGGSEDRSLISFNVMAVMAGGLEDGEGGHQDRIILNFYPAITWTIYRSMGQMNEN